MLKGFATECPPQIHDPQVAHFNQSLETNLGKGVLDDGSLYLTGMDYGEKKHDLYLTMQRPPEEDIYLKAGGALRHDSCLNSP